MPPTLSTESFMLSEKTFLKPAKDALLPALVFKDLKGKPMLSVQWQIVSGSPRTLEPIALSFTKAWTNVARPKNAMQNCPLYQPVNSKDKLMFKDKKLRVIIGNIQLLKLPSIQSKGCPNKFWTAILKKNPSKSQKAKNSQLKSKLKLER